MNRLGILTVLYALALLMHPNANADGALPEAFFGKYEGYAISSTDGDLSKRDLRVVIAPYKKTGFNVEWTTVYRKQDGRLKRKWYSINFRPSKRKNIYGSQMRTDMFGNPVPLNPLQGEPYVWARIEGSTLTVHALHITADGGYEMQIYDRSLASDGLNLRFSRVRDGKPLRTIEGKLKKVTEFKE